MRNNLSERRQTYCLYVCMCVCAHVCMHLCVYMRVCTCVCVCVCVIVLFCCFFIQFAAILNIPFFLPIYELQLDRNAPLTLASWYKWKDLRPCSGHTGSSHEIIIRWTLEQVHIFQFMRKKNDFKKTNNEEKIFECFLNYLINLYMFLEAYAWRKKKRGIIYLDDHLQLH